MDPKKVFDNLCAVPNSLGVVMMRDNGTIVRASGDLYEPSEAFALTNLMKDSTELISIVRPSTESITRVTITRQSGISVTASSHQGHIFALKLSSGR